MKRRTNQIGTLGLLVALTVLLSHCREDALFYTNTLRSDVFTQDFATDRVDFLWVFDNSDSMAPKREYVKDEMNTFLTILNSRKAIDYRMAATTTDFFTHAGALVEDTLGNKVVSSGAADPVGDFAAIINNVQDSFTSFWEQGLESAYAALVNHGNEFSRTGVPLIIIILTDEEDFSCKSNCFGQEPENNPNWVPHTTSRYSNYFNNAKTAEGASVSVFPIVKKANSNCDFSIGARYETVQTAVDEDAATGSICNSDLPASYQAIAQNIADRGVLFTLTSPASGEGIIVLVDGETVPYSEDNGYIFVAESNAIQFTGAAVPPNGSSVEVLYNESN